MSESTRLNVDVLAVTCKFLTDISDILSFAHTCSSLRPIAIGWLLSMRPLYIQDGASVRRFHSFLFADAPARMPHIRALDIAYPPRLRFLPTLPNDSSLLRYILTSCPHLERISIYLQDGFHRCTDDPQIIDAIIGIQTLRSLSIHGWSIHALDLLRGVHAPLREIDIDFKSEKIDFWSPGALEMLLPRSVVSTLEKLGLCNFITDIYETQTHNVPSNVLASSRPYLNITPYPAVRSLRLRFLLQRPLLDHLQHFFPALDDTLSLGALDQFIPDGEACDDLRAANQHAQEGPQNSPAHPRAWKKLDKLICDPRMLYVLGLRCAIRLVVLDSYFTHTMWFAATALRTNPVPRLKLSFRLSKGCDVLDGLFSPELARALTHLTVCFLFDNDGGPGNDADPETVENLRWEDLLNAIRSALQPLHALTHLRIVVHSSIHNDLAAPVAYSESFVRATRASDFDFAGTAAVLARPLPSLQYVFLTTSGYLAERDDMEASRRFWKSYERWYVDRAWRVANPIGTGSEREGERVLVELHEDVAETIMRNEELGLSEVDEVMFHLDED